ncbi:MAG: acetyltransferase [Bryobacterales bacterium]|nr:acetyltransferase [Bryobacterales bacterium]
MIALRHLETLAEFQEAVRLQQEIWGFDDIELLPVRLFVVATKVGGQAIGAFDGGRMIGFLLAIPGLKGGGGEYLHSHMMGVMTPYRNAGVGRMLKLKQREEALARGLKLVEWTFDPLEIKNAYFNMELLGAVVRRYVLNQYGTTTSHLHGGLPTDRCVAEWYIASDRVAAIIAHKPLPPVEVLARISLPVDIDAIRRDEPKRAREIQKGISDQFLECFDRNWAVIGFERSATEGTYLLGPWEPE